LPSTAAPSAQEWNDIGADVILAKQLKRLVRRRHAFMGEGTNSLLPCRHAGLMIRAVKIVTEFDAPIWCCDGSADAYITPSSEESTSEHAMVFKPNYGRDRAERARAARAHSEERQRKKDEKTALRRAKRAETDPAPDQPDPPADETQS
jgi:hypothetical protein